MKKIFLLCAVLGAGQLYGMEPENPRPKSGNFGYLPKELETKIFQTAVSHSKTYQDAIAMIQKLSKSFGVEYGKSLTNFKNFSKLVAMLAIEFNTPPYSVAQEIVSQFELPQELFNEYKLNFKQAYQLTRAINNNDIAWVTKLIDAGADVNFIFTRITFNNYKDGKLVSTGSYNYYTPFDYAVIKGSNTEIAQLLLDAGATVHPNSYYDEHGYSMLDNPTDEDIKKEKLAREKIREMINEAITKQRQQK